jgi:uncharacterized membrane protein YhiD involved in acid resistance
MYYAYSLNKNEMPLPYINSLLATCMLTSRVVVACWIGTLLGIKIGYSNPKVGALTRCWVCFNCSTCDINSN